MKPNTGKSSLLNALLNYDKAIVSNVAGTTRDVVEGAIDINGVRFNLYDTAGIRDSEDKIEELGIENVAFGAHFIEALKTSKIPTWLYEAESFSKNVILTKDKVQITPSSFDLKPIKIIEL